MRVVTESAFSSPQSDLDSSGEGIGASEYARTSSNLWFGTVADVRQAEKDGISGFAALQSMSDLTMAIEDIEVVFVQCAKVPQMLQHLSNLRIFVIGAHWPCRVLPIAALPISTMRTNHKDFAVTPDDLRGIRLVRGLSPVTIVPEWLHTLPQLHVLCTGDIKGVEELNLMLLRKLEMTLSMSRQPLQLMHLPLLQELDLTLSRANSPIGREMWDRLPGLRVLSINGEGTTRILDLERLECLTNLTISGHDLREVAVADHGLQCLTSLDITSSSLFTLPSGLFQSRTLSRVRLVGMTAFFQNGFPGMQHAQSLDELCIESIGDVDLDGVLEIPAETLANLGSLVLDQFEGRTVPYDRMGALEKLACSYSREPLTAQLHHLHKLRELHLSGPVALPMNLGDLASLEVFRCTSDTIRELPPSMSMLLNLRALELYLPKATTLPYLANLSNLETLDVATCSLQKLPPGLDRLVALEELTLCSSVLNDTLPPSVLELPSLTAVSVGRVEDSHWFI